MLILHQSKRTWSNPTRVGHTRSRLGRSHLWASNCKVASLSEVVEPRILSPLGRGVSIEDNPFDVVKCCFFEQNGNVEPYSRRSLFRKPDIGMLALIEYECFERGICIDWDDSIFVGDREEDKDCAIAAGVTFMDIDEFLACEITFSQSKN